MDRVTRQYVKLNIDIKKQKYGISLKQQNVTLQQPLETLNDVSSSGRKRPWREKKMVNLKLSKSYKDLAADEDNIYYANKAQRLFDCGDFLQFEVSENGKQKLIAMNSCHVRLCPVCTWRRSLKIFSQTNKIMDSMNQEYEYNYIILTLTVENCEGRDLSNTLDDMFKAWGRFSKRKEFRNSVIGWYRALEVTHNVDRSSDSYNTYHPHFHCVLAVRKGYFKSENEYISHEKWTSLWAESMRLGYKPSVDVRKVKGNTARAVAEVAKYAVKDGDYLVTNDWDLTKDSVKILDKALHKRRLVAYGGVMKDWHRKLNLDDVIDGDLVNVGDDDNKLVTDEGRLLTYVWNVGYNQYFKCF